MAGQNFQKDLDNLLSSLTTKPSLLLHACCGPCSSYCLEYLSQYFQITVFFYNPNIYPREEYYRRLNELKNFYTKFPPVLQGQVKLVECDYNPDEFYDYINVRNEPELAKEAEKGERCRCCYELRLKKAYDYARKNAFDYFCTTLSISPFKDAVKINAIGSALQKEGNQLRASVTQVPGSDNQQSSGEVLWLPSDFKKKSGFLRSLELSKEYGLYRQEYCGCIYSIKS
ncbi:MAG: epoxyqueuosine reductase QueH [Treponema sp.]|nr:epoxyqueuosine reductase QueH [Treponema sp.]